MQTTKLALHTIKDNGLTSDVEINENGMAFVDVNNDTIISTKHYIGFDGMEHDAELHRFQSILNSKFTSTVAVMYEVHIYTKRDDGKICGKYRYKTLDAARKAYRLYSGEKRMS